MRCCSQMKKMRGFTLLELVVVVSVISILAVVLLGKVLRYQEEAERVAMEQVAANIQAGLNLQVAAMIARGQESQLPDLVNENPMDWLAKPPPNYLGERFDPGLSDLKPGYWYFDLKDKTLVYEVDRGEHFMADSSGRKEIRYRVSLIYGNKPKENVKSADTKEVSGVILELIKPYQWFETKLVASEP